jgi:hypothetical protein
VVPEMERGRATPAWATATFTDDGRGNAETAAPVGVGQGFHPAAWRVGRCGCEPTARSGC